MASSARRDPVRELALLVRAPEPGSTNLGEHVAANAAELAQVLGIDRRWLEAVRATDDEEVVSRIRQLLARARDRHVQQDLEGRRQRSLEAAERLGASSKWTDLGAELDVDLLLVDLLADRTRRWVRFLPEAADFTTTIPTHLIAAARPVARRHLDLGAWVDAQGLHFRWRGGRGGYDWHPHTVDARFAEQLLTVPLARRGVQIPERRQAGAWLGHILQELGYL